MNDQSPLSENRIVRDLLRGDRDPAYGAEDITAMDELDLELRHTESGTDTIVLCYSLQDAWRLDTETGAVESFDLFGVDLDE
jgi:hypothetical protein